MSIVNGRKTGDPWGEYTSYQWNGRAVVDYVVASSPWVSDHCPLIYDFKSLTKVVTEDKGKLDELPKSFHFSPEDRQKFKETLNSDEMVQEMRSLSRNENMDPQTLASLITEFLLKVCDKAGVKPRKREEKQDKSEPWFDRDCKTIKNSLKKKCKKLRANQKDENLRREIISENKSFKKLVKQKKENYKRGIINDLSLKRKDHKVFWKLLDKLKNRTRDKFMDHIPPQKWNEHFKQILRDEREPNYPPNSLENGPLDCPITADELEKASYVLKPNKASGLDSVSNEMILELFKANKELIIILFNGIFKNTQKIDQWSVGLISPIFKAGDKMFPGNYRGISVISCLGKLYTSVLNLRLKKYVIEKNILSKEQLGFVEGNRTSDAHIILDNLLQHYCHKEGKRIYSCFVDFSKAFDGIPRDILFNKLLKYGINGTFFNNIKNLYENDVCQVKLADGLTERFLANQGVKQGCILSPLLFNIFLADLPSYLSNSVCEAVKIHESNRISCIIWADDILIFSESENGLQTMLNNLAVFTKENGMKINAKKTKAMIFNKSGKFFKRSYTLGESQIFTTNSYKYLGFMVTPSGEISTGLKDLKDRAQRAYFKLKKTMGNYFRLYPSITTHIFDTLIKPILMYNSDYWGCLKPPNNNPIENMHLKFCKELLGVHKLTATYGVLLELGRVPIMLYARKNSIKNWGRINAGKANPVVIQSYKDSLENESRWTQLGATTLDTIGTGRENLDELVFMSSMQRMTDIFHQEARTDMNRNDSKLRTYTKIKQKLGMENYLDVITNIKRRSQLSKLRLSNHVLMIEKGRHSGIEACDRVCPLCQNGNVEDELHFLLKCKTYSHLRQKLISKAEQLFPHIGSTSGENLMKILLNNDKLIHDASTFIEKAFELREFILNNHKNLN